MKTFAFKNFFEGFGLALNLERFKIAFLGTFLVIIVYALFMWFGILTENITWYNIFTIIGTFLTIIISTLVNGLIAKTIINEKIQDNTDFSKSEYLSQHKFSLILTPFCFIGIIILLIGSQALIHWISKIPGIGHLIFSLTFIIQFFMSIIAIFTLLVLFLGLFIYPSMIAHKNTDLSKTVNGLFNIIRKKGLLIFM